MKTAIDKIKEKQESRMNETVMMAVPTPKKNLKRVKPGINPIPSAFLAITILRTILDGKRTIETPAQLSATDKRDLEYAISKLAENPLSIIEYVQTL